MGLRSEREAKYQVKLYRPVDVGDPPTYWLYVRSYDQRPRATRPEGMSAQESAEWVARSDIYLRNPNADIYELTQDDFHEDHQYGDCDYVLILCRVDG